MDPPIPASSVSRLRFWFALGGFVLAAWTLDRCFGLLASRAGLDDSTRALWAHFSAGGARPIVLSFLLHHLPKAALVTAAAWIALGAMGRQPRRMLLTTPTARGWGWVALGLAAVALWQLLRAQGLPGPLGAVWLGLHAARFGPSAWTEEVTFRAVLFGALLSRFGPGVAWSASLAIFAATHLYGGAALALHATVVGAIFTATYRATGALWACALLHLASNLLHAVLQYPR